jgi:RNA polymerase sigma-70 factor (ECF subfamily)
MTIKNSEALWLELSDGLGTFIRRRVANPQDADDILQDVFFKIHKHIGQLQDHRRVHGWVYQIVRNAIVDHYRRQRIFVELPDSLPDDNISPEPTVNQEMAACLGSFIDRLPDKYKDAIVLTHFEGLTQKEMGQKLGLSPSGAKSRVQRARKQLETMLLACCHYEFDYRGDIVAYQSRENSA